VKSATLFALTALVFLAYWSAANPSFEASPPQREWPRVLAFSGIILTLAFAVAQFAPLVGGRIALRAALAAAGGGVLSKAANILEDGLGIEWGFFGFIFGEAITFLGLLALTIAIAARDGQRFFALVPAGTMAGLLFFVIAGGPLMLATWLLAAALALAPAPAEAEDASAPGLD